MTTRTSSLLSPPRRPHHDGSVLQLRLAQVTSPKASTRSGFSGARTVPRACRPKPPAPRPPTARLASSTSSRRTAPGQHDARPCRPVLGWGPKTCLNQARASAARRERRCAGAQTPSGSGTTADLLGGRGPQDLLLNQGKA